VLSSQDYRCVLTYPWYMSYSKDLILLFGVWDCAQKPHILSDDQAIIGCIASTCKRAEQVFPLSNMGVQVSHWTFQPPASPTISCYIQTTYPPGYEKPPMYIRRRISSVQVMCTGSAAHDWLLCPFFMSAMHLHWYDCLGLAIQKGGTYSQGGHHGEPKIEL
jgi:hypothetical protein